MSTQIIAASKLEKMAFHLYSICRGYSFRNNCLFVHLVCLEAQTPQGNKAWSCYQQAACNLKFSSSSNQQEQLHRVDWRSCAERILSLHLWTLRGRIKFLSVGYHQNNLPIIFLLAPWKLYYIWDVYFFFVSWIKCAAKTNWSVRAFWWQLWITAVKHSALRLNFNHPVKERLQ